MKQGWEKKRIGDVCKVIAGQSPEGKYYNEDGKGMPFYQGKKEYGDKYIGEPTTWTTIVTKEAEAGDILMSVRAPVGPINFSTQKICIGRGLAAIRATKLIDKEFLYSFLLKHETEIVGNTGAVFNSINKAQIEAIKIPLPPLPEQQRIVAILDEAFSAIATAKENAEKNLQNARELFESYLQGVFANPGDGWEEKTLNQISENLDSQRVPITKNVRSSGSIPYYGASGIVDYVDEYIFDDDLLLVSEDGANLLARTYPIAFSISGKTWVNNHAHVLRFENMVNQRFVEFYLNAIKLDDYVSGMAQPKLNQTMLNTIVIPYPPLKEQRSVVAKLDALSAETKRLEDIYRQKLADLDELKKSVLQKAFNGELKT
ncbi:MAG: Restriction endonuclease subunit [Candidatus Brocadiaceae bacterium]|nr:Restriction endonuclease subunit [Candidatus Brocadiaceae bacterium]